MKETGEKGKGNHNSKIDHNFSTLQASKMPQTSDIPGASLPGPPPGFCPWTLTGALPFVPIHGPCFALWNHDSKIDNNFSPLQASKMPKTSELPGASPPGPLQGFRPWTFAAALLLVPIHGARVLPFGHLSQ